MPPVPPVPTTREVIPGALVNIVLKADQPTGRTVTGPVQELLTRGNHPRGIKVRLADGRVGRVQSLVLPGRPERDPTAQQGGAVPSRLVGLDAYVKQGKQGKPRGGKGVGSRGDAAAGAGTVVGSETRQPTADWVACPVCPTFEGDQAAVSHHVASHFEE